MATSPDDQVYFPDVIMSDVGKISEMAGRACLSGTMSAGDYRFFRALCFETEWFNDVRYADGT